MIRRPVIHVIHVVCTMYMNTERLLYATVNKLFFVFKLNINRAHWCTEISELWFEIERRFACVRTP